jgi:hypothetical protein
MYGRRRKEGRAPSRRARVKVRVKAARRESLKIRAG